MKGKGSKEEDIQIHWMILSVGLTCGNRMPPSRCNPSHQKGHSKSNDCMTHLVKTMRSDLTLSKPGRAAAGKNVVDTLNCMGG